MMLGGRWTLRRTGRRELWMVMNIRCIHECSFQRIKGNHLRREARSPVVRSISYLSLSGIHAMK